MKATKKGGAPTPRARSGWVSDDDRHTVPIKIRCSPELAERARRAAKGNGMTLGELLLLGVLAAEHKGKAEDT